MVELCVQRSCEDIPTLPPDAQEAALYGTAHQSSDPREHKELLCVLDLDE
jgi:hypothetical protein